MAIKRESEARVQHGKRGRERSEIMPREIDEWRTLLKRR